jgi:hypothetical protein
VEPAAAHVRRELQRFDLLLQREIVRLRGRYQLSLDELRGLYISHQQIDDLVRQTQPGVDPLDLTVAANTLRAENRAVLPIDSEWRVFVARLALTSAEEDLLIAALALEVDPKYEQIYAYLNNDVTRRYVTRDLALRLFPMHDAAELRACLVADAPLFHLGLLRRAGAGFTAGPVAARCLLSPDAAPVAPLQRHTRWIATADPLWTRVAGLARPGKVLIFAGTDDTAALDAAAAVASTAGRPLLVLDGADLMRLPAPVDDAVADITLQCRMEDALLFVRNGTSWLGHADPPAAAARLVRDAVDLRLVFGCAQDAPYRQLFADAETIRFTFGAAPYEGRRHAWAMAAAAHGIECDSATIEDVARRFALTRTQITRAAAGAADARTVAGGDGTPRAWMFDAARAQCNDALGSLAVKIVSPFRWHDLVLPASLREQLQAVAGAIANRHVVYDEWGMAMGTAGRGINVLLSGSSGTGKSTSAGVIASEIGLDLYRIDLSTLVSKYIGETEKNIERVFAAARDSNAILFFDEADALFGRRSEVKDAHDRYANIEVAYLLQKMEGHDAAAVILGTNLASNLDDAFARRMHFVVDFPLPDATQRRQLWRQMFPPQAPLAADVDLPFLAEHFTLSGGQIRAISLDAAFLAAQNGRVITMGHLVRAVGRHLVREGRLPSATDFRQHFTLLTASA